MGDQFSDHYQDLLEGSYDCVDRIVLNAYFPMGVNAGGFRCCWRLLHGSDANLDNAHLMRMASRFSRRLRAWAKAHQVPVVNCSPAERKQEIAAQYLSTHEVKPGLFMILVARAPAFVWNVQMSGGGKIGNIERKKPRPYVNHYHFHILDPQWGHVTIRMSGHPPKTTVGGVDFNRPRMRALVQAAIVLATSPKIVWTRRKPKGTCVRSIRD